TSWLALVLRLARCRRYALPLHRGIIHRLQHAVLDLSHHHAMLGAGHALDLGPFGVGHEGRPRRRHGRLVRPFQQVDELGPVGEFRLPHRDNAKAVAAAHDPRRVVAEAGVEGGLVVLEDLVDAQLLNHGFAFYRAVTTA